MTLAVPSAAKAIVFALSIGVALSAATALADAEAGKDEFMRRCAACHGAGGVGDGPIAHHFKAAPSDLSTLQDENGGVFPRDQIIAVIDGRDWLDAHGDRTMPIWGEIFAAISRDSLEGEFGNPEDVVIERIEDIVDYIETLQR